MSLELRGVSVGYDKKVLIHDISFDVEPGKIVTLIGPNGAGKSTILKTISKQLEPLGGSVFLSGKDMAKLKEKEIAREMSLVMTDRIRTEHMSCRDVVAMGRFPYTGTMGVLSEDDWKMVDETMETLDMGEIALRDFMAISDGQRQRVLLAKALCQEPKVLLMDEPTSYLDLKYKIEILSTIRKLCTEKRIAVLMSLHELDFARKISDYIICIRGERIHRMGKPEEIFDGAYLAKLFDIDLSGTDFLQWKDLLETIL